MQGNLHVIAKQVGYLISTPFNRRIKYNRLRTYEQLIMLMEVRIKEIVDSAVNLLLFSIIITV